jgi:hypothetical protein
MDSFNYTFPAMRGVQARREFFVAMCPLRLVSKIFLFDEQEIPPELRAQRVLNRARIPAITIMFFRRSPSRSMANWIFSRSIKRGSDTSVN